VNKFFDSVANKSVNVDAMLSKAGKDKKAKKDDKFTPLDKDV